MCGCYIDAVPADSAARALRFVEVSELGAARRSDAATGGAGDDEPFVRW
jgi:hypothetical protein